METSQGRNLVEVTQPISLCHPLASLSQGPNIIPADIIFIVKEKLHPHFRRENDNLFYVKPIPLGKVSGQNGRAGSERSRVSLPLFAPSPASNRPMGGPKARSISFSTHPSAWHRPSECDECHKDSLFSPHVGGPSAPS